MRKTGNGLFWVDQGCRCRLSANLDTPPSGMFCIGLLLAQGKSAATIPNMADKKTSQHRTDMAEDRTSMANGRTFSSWMGTGLGAIGVAIGMKAVFGAFEPTWAAKAVASIFIAIDILIF